jgi:hypothetical protein
MARRRSYIARKPPGEPLDRWMGSLEAAVMGLRDRIVDRERLELTQQEMLDLLVPPEYHEPLKTVSSIVRHSYYLDHNYVVQWESRAAIKFECSKLLAVDVLDHPYTVPLTNPEAAERVTAWLDRRLELAHEFGRVVWLLRRLNEHCKTLGHVRYYWPAILTLCSANDQLKDLADKLRVASVSAPPLPVNVRTVCGLAAGTVTAAALLSDDIPPDNREVKVNLMLNSGATVPDEHAGCAIPLL